MHILNRFGPMYLLCFVVKTDLERWYRAVFIKTNKTNKKNPKQSQTEKKKIVLPPYISSSLPCPLHSFSFLVVFSVPFWIRTVSAEGSVRCRIGWMETGLNTWGLSNFSYSLCLSELCFSYSVKWFLLMAIHASSLFFFCYIFLPRRILGS